MKDFNGLPTKAKIERWENVLRVLRGLTRHQRTKHWDMDAFLDLRSCGTVGCAAGHCALDPWFRRRGFKAVPYDDTYGDGEDYMVLADDVDLPQFFGEEGTDRIFENRAQRPVGKVIREVKDYIKELRSA